MRRRQREVQVWKFGKLEVRDLPFRWREKVNKLTIGVPSHLQQNLAV
jgi:predicted lipid carrier protein YhbT